MHSNLSDTVSMGIVARTIAAAPRICLGQIVAVSRNGVPLVDYPGNPGGPLEAKYVAAQKWTLDRESCESVPVLLAFDPSMPSSAFILGMVHEAIECRPAESERELPSSSTREVVVDGKRIIVSAREELVLRCGKSSVTLRKDGKILVKGTELVSHASGTNRVKGSTVAIN